MIKLTQLIKELGINKPIKIKPENNISGYINLDGYLVSYHYEGTYVFIDLLTDGNLYDKYAFDGNDDEEEYYPEAESELACNDYIMRFRAFFGDDVTIEKDNYGCSNIHVPIDSFNRILNLVKKSIVKYLGDGKFQYKDNILILKELSPQERKIEQDKYLKYNHEAYPHMNYDKDPEKCLRYSDFISENKVYYMLDKDGNILKSIYNPAAGVRNSIFSIPKEKDIEDYALNLLPYFKRYFQ